MQLISPIPFCFDADLPQDMFLKARNEGFTDAKRLSNIMETGECVEWWKKNGVSIRLKFDWIKIVCVQSCLMNIWRSINDVR